MSMNDQEYINYVGKAIVQRRKALGLSQADLAYRVNMEVPNLSVIENGKSNPQVLTLLKISSALDSNLSEFLPTLSKPRQFLEQPSAYVPQRRKKKA